MPVHEIDELSVKPGQEVVVDGDFMLMYSASLEVNLANARSGEGFVYRLRGAGSVWVTPSARIA